MVTSGGSYMEAMRTATYVPASKMLGITIKEDLIRSWADVRLQVQSGKPTWDIVEYAIQFCKSPDIATPVRTDRLLGGHQRSGPSVRVQGYQLGRRYDRLFDGARVEQEEVREQPAGGLGRFLRRREVPGHARALRPAALHARGRGAGRRRADGQDLSARRRQEHQEGRRLQQERHRLLRDPRPGRAASDQRRDRHDGDPQRPRGRGDQGRRERSTTPSTRASRMRAASASSRARPTSKGR